MQLAADLRRLRCALCHNSPLPLSCLTSLLPQGLVEEAPREGRGGGFLEREEVVQYKSSRFQDDEDK